MSSLLFLKDITVTFGGAPLFSGISFQLQPQEKICLIGRNGCGKSTLLKVIAGEVEADKGERYVRPGLRIGYLPQSVTFKEEESVYDYVLSDIAREKDANAEQTPEETHYLADMVLGPLRLSGDKLMRRLSGGKLRRAALARALISDPDVLLLDEPTNHLDLTSIEWLESYLKTYKGALICISHDRAFLKQTSQKTFWLDRGKLRISNKGYSHFEEWSSQVQEAELQEIQRLEKKVEEENLWLQQGVTARRKRNQRRLAEVYQLRGKLQEDKSSQKRTTDKISLAPLSVEMAGKMVIEMDKVSHAFHDVDPPKVTIRNLSLRVMRGECIGVMGRNGAGKTTFLRLLTGQYTPDSGTVRYGSKLDITYFDQKRETLNPDITLWQTLCPDGGDTVKVGENYRHVAAYLKDFLFDSTQIKSPVSTLSGGEASRLLLARNLANPGNFLILDEPTNDLDMDTLDLLEEMLSEYKGTCVIVSHDRDFLDRLATRTLIFEGEGVVEDYVGGYSDYMMEKKAESIAVKAKAAASASLAPAAGNAPATAKSSTKLSYKLQRELENLPGIMEAITAEIAQLEEKLASPEFYSSNPEGFTKTSALLEEKKQTLLASEERWLELEEMQEQLKG